MSDSIKNLYEFQITSKILKSDGATDTFTISNDILTWTAVSLTNASILIENGNKTIRELMKWDATGWVFTIDSRGIKPDGTTSTTLQYERPKGTTAKVVVLQDQIFDKSSTETITWDLTYTWDVVYTKSILYPVYADATARDAAITTPVNGMMIYNTALWLVQQYVSWAWENVDTGTATANASETVAGKVELATAAERAAGTATWGTWASLVVTNNALVKTSSGASDENKVPVLNSDWYVVAFIPATSTTVAGLVELATDAEALAGTDETRYINSKQLNQYWYVIESGTDVTAADAATDVTGITGGTYAKKKELTIVKWGTYKITMEMTNTNSSWVSYAKIYINWVAAGTEFSIATASTSSQSEDFTVNAWDTVEMWVYHTGVGSATASTLKAQYSVADFVTVTLDA